MELFFMIFGVAMLYSWIHAIVIISRNLKETTDYQKVVLWFAVIGFGLYVLGTL